MAEQNSIVSLRERFKQEEKLPEYLVDYGISNSTLQWLLHILFERQLSRLQMFIYVLTVAACLLVAIIYPTQFFCFVASCSESPAAGIMCAAGCALILVKTIVSLLRPTHLGVSAAGVRLYWARVLGRRPSRTVAWTEVTNVELIQPRGTVLVEQQLLQFRAQKDRITLALKHLYQHDQRETLLDFINHCASAEARNSNIAGLVGAAHGVDYTEIWLKALSAPPQRERIEPLHQGMVLNQGGYEILDTVGAGGQGTAYLALSLRPVRNLPGGATVVIKEYVLPIQVKRRTMMQSVDRLEREAKLLTKLDHPKIVKLLDFFIEDHRGYLVLEYVKGANLREIVATQGTFSESQVCNLAMQMCTIQEYLHSQTPQVVHRDFTPDNLLLTPEGQLKLIDFNVAHETASTITASVVGKHAYIPKEQFRGRPTPASDIYALGGTIYFLLTGHDPVPLTSSHPGERTPDISFELDDLVSWATAVEQGDRMDIDTMRQRLARMTVQQFLTV